MSERMYRAQILLDPHQRRKLEEIARREGRSISSVTRQMIDLGLQTLENEADLWVKRTRVLSQLRAIREKQPVEYGGNLIEEARQEREDEVNRVWRGDS
jgi:predicted YcjX-like family ATPase